MKQSQRTVLAIESAISGGSISLLRDGIEIGNWIGDLSSVSKAENLLVNIDEVLAANTVDRGEIDLIAVSAGPGSFTGIRIGIATALGLKAGLGIEMASESALKAMIYEGDARDRELIAALLVGRNSVCVQRFREALAVDEPRTVTEEAFISLVEKEREAGFLIHAELYGRVSHYPAVINAGANIARSIGLICGLNRDVIAEPLFIAKRF